MSRQQLSRSSALQAALVAVLVIGVLMLLVVSGHRSQERSADDDGSSSVVPARELPQGMKSIASDTFFDTVTEAQRAARTWRVVSVSEVDGAPSAPSVQEINLGGPVPAIRTMFDSGTGTIEALFIGEDFYVKGFSGQETPWWKVSTEGAAGQLIQSLAPYADPTEFLSSIKGVERFEVIGVEDIAVGKGETKTEKTVHYRLQLDASDDQEPVAAREATTGGTPVTMDMWVDGSDRPVRVETSLGAEGKRLTTTLYYLLYGEPIEIAAPAVDQVTTETPAELTGTVDGGTTP